MTPIAILTPEQLEALIERAIALALARAPVERRPVTVPEAARDLGISTRTLRRRIKAGEIPIVRVGRAVRVDLAELRRTQEETARAAHVTLHAVPG
jgi:excisionase family DNA binding protein